jgi:hypothetical protein
VTTAGLWGDLKVSDFLAVRAAILEVSKKAFSTSTLDQLRPKRDIGKERKRAKEAGRRSEEFDPHSRFFNLLDWISVRKKAVIILVATAGLIAHRGFGVSEEQLVNVVSTISSPILYFGALGVLGYTLWNLYILSLRYNRKTIRHISAKIRYSDKRIETETSVENVRAYRRWNSNLTSSKSLSYILLLAAARSFVPSMFAIGTEASKEWVPEYVDMQVTDIVDDGESDSRETNDNNE